MSWKDILKEERFDHDVKHVKGFHPKYKHLAYYEIEPHYGSYILTSPAKEGSILMNEDDARDMFEDRLDDGYGYFMDDYLDYFEKE
ncbi:MAG: hypothetical protein GOVbin556_58 [Prokaryotic dsDNA virus sp.]|nr:MAG: hypothetical protein GOVbin556_58 [Prokaryotic dsDNA virus sp.]|tara:strand:- start:25429 stop:25686 length:258 start_codon:yes stop_codon:yes gene_type:complete